MPIADQWKVLNPQQRDQAIARMTPEQKTQLASALGFKGSSPAPKAETPGFLTKAKDYAVDSLPAIGGTVGGVLGAAAGVESGPGAVATEMLGAAAGGALGERARQFIKDPKMESTESAMRMAGQGSLQAVNELGGRVAGKIAGKVLAPIAERFPVLQHYPFLATLVGFGEKTSPKAAEHLTSAAATPGNAGKVLDAVANTVGDIEQEMRKLPASQRTVEGFLSSVNARKDAMNVESGAALLPIAGQRTVPMGVSTRIRSLIHPYMDHTASGRAEKSAIIRASKDFEKPWTYQDLDAMRTTLASQLSKHRAKGTVARYAAQKGDTDLAIDNMIEGGLRDTVYPAMDRAAGKPAGYFANLKGRQSSLIQLQDILEKRISDLKGQQAVSSVGSRFTHENVGVSAHPGSLPRASVYGLKNAVLGPKKVLKQANKQVGKAFPSVNSMPYEELFKLGIRGSQVQGPAPRKEESEQNATDAYASPQAAVSQ